MYAYVHVLSPWTLDLFIYAAIDKFTIQSSAIT